MNPSIHRKEINSNMPLGLLKTITSLNKVLFWCTRNPSLFYAVCIKLKLEIYYFLIITNCMFKSAVCISGFTH